jgi:putative transposase
MIKVVEYKQMIYMSGDRYKIADQNGVYFLTFTVVNWMDVFTRKELKLIIVDSLNYCIENKGLTIYGWVLMSNHLHLLAKAEEGNNLSEIIRDFKKFTSKRISEAIIEIDESRRKWLLDKFSFEAKRTGRAKYYKVWKDDNHAIVIDNAKMFDQKLNYIHQNPVKQLIVEQPESFLFSSAIDYSGGKGLVKIVVED